MASKALINVSSALGQLLTTVEIRSAFSPPYKANVSELIAASQQPGPPSPYLALVKPTIILDGPLGPQTIAPAGLPSPDDWKKNLLVAGILATAAGIGIFAMGVRYGEHKRR